MQISINYIKTKTSSEKNLFSSKTIGDYTIIRQIGKGSFGIIYEASLTSMTGSASKDGKNQLFALKLEKGNNKEGNLRSQLQKEILILKEINNRKSKGFAELIDYGINKGNPFMVTTLLGNNLSKVLEKNGGIFSQETVMKLAYQMIDRLSFFHEIGYLHRDLKPENFVLGSNNNLNTLYLIDFGLSKRYLEKGSHIPMILNKGFVGTARYCSPNAHRGYEQGRRDDLISVGFLLMYFLKGKLPWQGKIVDKKDKKYESIGKIKEDLDYESFFKGFDESFLQYMKYVNNLRFDDAPNYIFLKEIFVKSYDRILKEKKEPKTEEKIIEEKELKEQSDKFLEELTGENNEKNKISTGKFASTAHPNMFLSKSSTLNPNYDASSCDIIEEEVNVLLNKPQKYEFINSKNKSKGEITKGHLRGNSGDHINPNKRKEI